jgi:hypothetical protein
MRLSTCHQRMSHLYCDPAVAGKNQPAHSSVQCGARYKMAGLLDLGIAQMLVLGCAEHEEAYPSKAIVTHGRTNV